MVVKLTIFWRSKKCVKCCLFPGFAANVITGWSLLFLFWNSWFVLNILSGIWPRALFTWVVWPGQDPSQPAFLLWQHQPGPSHLTGGLGHKKGISGPAGAYPHSLTVEGIETVTIDPAAERQALLHPPARGAGVPPLPPWLQAGWSHCIWGWVTDTWSERSLSVGTWRAVSLGLCSPAGRKGWSKATRRLHITPGRPVMRALEEAGQLVNPSKPAGKEDRWWRNPLPLPISEAAWINWSGGNLATIFSSSSC